MRSAGERAAATAQAYRVAARAVLADHLRDCLALLAEGRRALDGALATATGEDRALLLAERSRIDQDADVLLSVELPDVPPSRAALASRRVPVGA